MKYLVVPGNVFSKNDGDVHYISASRIIHLYGVPTSLCIVITENEWIKNGHRPKYKGLVVLRPRFDGNYKLEKS